MIRAAHSRIARPAHRHLSTDDPRWFTADGQRKWKVKPDRVLASEKNRHVGPGRTWIERWKPYPKPGEKTEPGWVYNYTWAEVKRRAGIKFAKNALLGREVDMIRAQVKKDLRAPGKLRQLAMATMLIDQRFLRVGGEKSVREHDHYGATTLRKHHVHVDGDTVRLHFDGKYGKEWKVELTDARLAAAMRERLAEIRGPATPVFDITDSNVNAYLRPYRVTAKQFRTYHATRLAREYLLGHVDAPPPERKAFIRDMYQYVAEFLKHEPQADKKHYVDGMIVRAFEKGRLK